MPDHRLYDNIIPTMQSVRSRVIAWARVNGYVEESESFATEIQREVFKFIGQIVIYEESKTRSKAHKRRNYHTELESAVESLNTILDTVFEQYQNPIFREEEVELKKHRQMLTDVQNFLKSKQRQLEIDSMRGTKLIEEINLNAQREILSLYKRLRKLDLTGENGLKQHALFEKLSDTSIEITQDSEQLLKLFELEKSYSEATPNRSELRQVFVNNASLIYLDLTKRTDLNRTDKEIAQHKKNTFTELMQLCFDAIDERVTPTAMKKITTQANSEINRK